jgi:dihydropyrimidine dehydrogenase (NAD+) subunit PreT
MRQDKQFYRRAAPTGRKIAAIGAGPAGLAAAHRLARYGHDVTILEARPKAGGLNEYGIAAYKSTDDFAHAEVEYVTAIGGIDIQYGKALGRDAHLADLAMSYDAVFLGMGLAGVNALRAEGEEADGVDNAVDFIAALRQSSDLGALPVGRRVVVVGGGMTAVDAAVQSRKLGAEVVTIVYRRDEARMPASDYEREWAQRNGVTIRTWSVLKSLEIADGAVVGATFCCVNDVDGRLEETGDTWSTSADTVFKAIGQTLALADPTLATVKLRGGRIEVDAEGRTSLPGVWAGGDCTFGGQDLTVEAVEHGKIAAHSIDRVLAQRQTQTQTRAPIDPTAAKVARPMADDTAAAGLRSNAAARTLPSFANDFNRVRRTAA